MVVKKSIVLVSVTTVSHMLVAISGPFNAFFDSRSSALD